MQLGPLPRLVFFAFVVCLLSLAAPRRARAEGNVNARASTEIAGYTDSVGVSVFTPSVAANVENPTAGWGASGRYLVDVVSAASPDIVATASPRWSEVRHAGSVGARYKPGTFGVAVGGAASYTPDYLALAASGQLIQELDEKNLTLIEGYGYGHDTIGRNGTPFSVFSRELDTHSFTLGASRVVNQSIVIGVYGDAILERGDQSKPYRYIPMFSPQDAPTVPRGASAIEVADRRIVARPLEQLPLDRDRWALTGRLGWRGTRTTLRLEQRLYTDTWSLHASSTDLRYFIDVADRVTVWPHLRFHVQSGVSFWQRAYAATNATDLPILRTGDRELGALSNYVCGAGLRLALGPAASKNDIALAFTADGTYTSFADTIYVTERWAGLGTTSFEVAF